MTEHEHDAHEHGEHDSHEHGEHDSHEHDEHEHGEHDAHEHGEHDHHEHTLAYPDAVAEFRARQGRVLQPSPRSPIPEAERGSFTGLPYFAVDEALRFEDLQLEPYTGNEPSDFQIPTSDGQLRPAHRAGYLRSPSRRRPADVTGVHVRRRRRRVAVRAVPRRDERHRDATARVATSTSSPRTTARTRSTSTSPTTRRACTTRNTRAR